MGPPLEVRRVAFPVPDRPSAPVTIRTPSTAWTDLVGMTCPWLASWRDHTLPFIAEIGGYPALLGEVRSNAQAMVDAE